MAFGSGALATWRLESAHHRRGNAHLNNIIIARTAASTSAQYLCAYSRVSNIAHHSSITSRRSFARAAHRNNAASRHCRIFARTAMSVIITIISAHCVIVILPATPSISKRGGMAKSTCRDINENVAHGKKAKAKHRNIGGINSSSEISIIMAYHGMS